jgi:hypothetical protein
MTFHNMKAFWLLLTVVAATQATQHSNIKTYVRSGSFIAHRILQDDGVTNSTEPEVEDAPVTAAEAAEAAAMETMSENEQKDTCMQDTDAFLKNSPVVKNAADAYAGGMETKEDDASDGLRIGFPAEAVAAYQQTCDEQGGYWSFLDDAQFVCRSEQLQERQSMEVYGMGNCLADTTECQSTDPVFLVESVWDKLGLECTLATDGEPAASEPPFDENPPTNDNLADGEGGDTDEEGDAFLSTEDAACMEATSALMDNEPQLVAALQDYQQAVNMDGIEDTESTMTMSYSENAVAAMQQACNDAGGYWAVIESEDFVCSMMGIDQHLQVVNFGSCLADTQNCQIMDIGHLLESVWDVMGLSCWGSNDKGFPGGDGENSSGGADNEGGTNNGDVGNNEGDDFEDPPNVDGLDLPEGDKQCIADTQAMAQSSPDIDAASAEFGQSMEVNMKDMNDLKLGFPDVQVAKLSQACNATHGYFSFVKLQYFDCNMGGFKNTLKVYNIADCLADTEECKDMNPLRLMETVWKAMGVQCTEKSGDTGDGSGSGSDNPPPSNGSSGGNPEIIELGLSEDEVACMNDSDGFVQSSDQINLAAQTYAQSVEMNDPTRLGFPAGAAANMEQVCTENNGLWSSVDSEDVTCMIQGRERRINVYNFGNCLSNTNHCQSMDPMVLVKAFFWEVLHFKCWSKGESGPESSTHSTGGSSSVGSMQSSTTSSSDDAMPGYLTAVVVLIVVVAIGFGVMYKVRGRHGRERIRQYGTCITNEDFIVCRCNT